MASRLSAFVIWALVAGAALFWGLRLLASPLQAPPQTTAVSTAVAARGDLQRLLGVPAAEAAPVAVADSAGRFKLVGVVAPHRAEAADDVGLGVALLTVDDKPPRPFRVGALVDGDWRVASVQARRVTLAGAAGAAPLVLELPPLAAPAVGQLPVVSLGGAAARPAAPPPPGPAPAFVPAPPPPPAPVPAPVPGADVPMTNPGAPPPTLVQPPPGAPPSPATAR